MIFSIDPFIRKRNRFQADIINIDRCQSIFTIPGSLIILRFKSRKNGWYRCQRRCRRSCGDRRGCCCRCRCSFSILFLWETNSIPPNPARINRMISRIRAVFSRFFLLLFFLICITSVYYNISEILCVFPVSVYFFSLIIPFL